MTTQAISEQAILFGEYQHLAGVVNLAEKPHPANTAMILITAGMLHNVGPFRMYVDIARALAQQGVSSLRFDISGIGESLGVGAEGKSIERAASETSIAMDYMEKQYGIDHFILFGLCSGADDAIQAALDDSRVCGVINLDGLCYKTWRFKLRHAQLLARKLFSLSKWKKKLDALFGSRLAPASLALGTDVREYPDTPEEAAKQLQTLVDRDTKLHFIYTGGANYYNYERQFYDMLPGINWKGSESTCYFPYMDHVVMLCEDRKQLVEHVVEKTLEVLQS